MSVILADATTTGKGLDGTGVHLGDAWLVGDMGIERMHQVDQAVAIRTCLALLRGELADGVVGLGQAGEAQERQR